MTTVTVTIQVDADGGVRISGPLDAANGAGAPARPEAFQDELIPLPPEPAPVRPITAIGQARQGAAGTNGLCPVHGVAWRVVPAGISKKSGRAYAEFRACPEPGCDQRPR
ncbi:MAG: hypothetical protein ACLQBX_04125 [Candidatus Limnocylindrales bacterium]